ncbi:lipopolysaccharide kinase InaA family protein [Pseudomonas sp. OIL-1]|uniref:lipopolysaccharide kinase InaA family protein n=1 Tax=Pseudomonas sp. OIL-1 TaxID=2706126 RepID=UPI0013A7AA8F|nr:lipopolysaccharide kinase InaA family protein [Pseudomonas sp. OIL-1]QIB52985.1 toluene tolerance protein [Pseudomonas sp. OIL-1]
MQLMYRDEYDALRKGAIVVEQDGYGEKVLLLDDGTYIKLFRRKSWLSKSTLVPPAKRFAANAKSLQLLGIPCPQVINVFRLTLPHRSCVHYMPLAGTTLREIRRKEPELWTSEEITKLARFVNHLHVLGVYFRSLHLGNIVLCPDGNLGLIDISDMRCIGRSLSQRLRQRNIQHLLRYSKDWPEHDRKLLLNQLPAS